MPAFIDSAQLVGQRPDAETSMKASPCSERITGASLAGMVQKGGFEAAELGAEMCTIRLYGEVSPHDEIYAAFIVIPGHVIPVQVPR